MQFLAHRPASHAPRPPAWACAALGVCACVMLTWACVPPSPAPAPGPAASDDDGELVDAEEVAVVSRAQLQALVPAEIAVENGYAVYAVRYRTQGTEATATVTLPDGAAPAGGFATVANAHGTIGLDDPCSLSRTISGAGLAGLFGARGAIGVAPDYVGLGGPGLHPYLDVDSEARAVLDALRAARALAEREGLPTSARAAVVGLSQGGHAALAAGALQPAHAPEIELRAVGAAAPASGFREHWFGIDTAGAHQVFYALLAYAFAHQAGVDAHEVFGADVDADALFASRCLWSPRFDGAELLLTDALPTQPSALFRDETRAAFREDGAAQWVDDGFARVRLAPFSSTAAVRVWQGDADTTVLPAATAELVDALRAGGLQVELTTVPGGTHLDTAFGFLASLDRARDESIAWVRARLDE